MSNHNQLQSVPTMETSSGDLSAARAFAGTAHTGQERKLNGEAFIVHPYGVSEILQNEVVGISEATLIAAVLHDTVEMTDVTLDVIEQHFGKEVRDIVDGVTKRTGFATRKQKSEDYLHHLEHASPEESLLVALADKIHNIEDLIAQYKMSGDDIWSSFKAGAKGTIEWHQDVLSIGERTLLADHPLVQRLSRGVTTLRTLALGRRGSVALAMAT